jgi:hypothetical protein
MRRGEGEVVGYRVECTAFDAELSREESSLLLEGRKRRCAETPCDAVSDGLVDTVQGFEGSGGKG